MLNSICCRLVGNGVVSGWLLMKCVLGIGMVFL